MESLVNESSAGHLNELETSNDFVSKTFYFLFYCLIFSAPIILYGIQVAGFSARLSRVFILLIFPIFILKVLKKPSLISRNSFFVMGILPFFLYCGLTILWSPNSEAGFTDFGMLLELVLLYSILAVADLGIARLNTFVQVYVLSAIIPVGVAIWQFLNNFMQFSNSEVPFPQFLVQGKYESMEGRIFTISNGITRLSGTIGEPVIFSNYLCSVILFSLLLKVKNRFGNFLLRLFQFLMISVLFFSISKLAILSIFLGLLFISIQFKKFIFFFTSLTVTTIATIYLLINYDLLFMFERLGSESGHKELLIESLSKITAFSALFGEGMGSIEGGSFHRLAISRFYETGLVGLYFTLFLTALPFMIWKLPVHSEMEKRMKIICVGTLLPVIFGLHCYDFFKHWFSWLILGAVASYYYSEKERVFSR